ncbi:hypothetical protein [Azorhizophilus paspali]|uniref:Transposase n=1 Tax=Azorhizophilus paspali TaxID=69963 RepID=A0ABV6ST20_AZOPA
MAREQYTAELKQLRDELAKAQARGEEAAQMRSELERTTIIPGHWT